MSQTVYLDNGQPIRVSDEVADMTPEEVQEEMARLASEADAAVVRQDYDASNYNTLLPGEIAGELQEVEEGNRDYIPDAKLADLNDNFNSDALYQSNLDTEYDTYLAGREKAIAEQDAAKLQEWDNYYKAFKNRRDTFSKFNECSIEGKCEEGNEAYWDISKNTTADWKYTDQVHNVDLLKSLRRTYGNYKKTGKEAGKPLSDKELVDMMMADQTYTDNNMVKLGVDAATLDGLTEQQKKDFLLQFMTYEKIAATGEGSRDVFTQAAQVGGAITTDPTSWGIVLSGVAAPFTAGARITAKALGKKEIKDHLKKSLGKSMAKSGAIGGSYVGTYDALRQSIKIQGGVQDDMDWGQFAMSAGLGVTLGSGLGSLVYGGSKAFNNLATKYMIKNKIGNREFLKQIRDNVTDEKSLYRWLKNIGWTRKEAKEEIAYLERENFKYDAAERTWKSSTQDYKPPINERLTEKSHFGKQVLERIVPKAMQRKGEEVMDKEYINIANIDIPIEFSRMGTNLFNLINSVGATIGPKIARTLYGSDAILVRSGLRREAMAINDAMAATDINVARMSHKLRDLVDKDAERIGDINALIRDRNPTNKAQSNFLKELDILKNSQVKMAYRNKLITAEEYQAFLKDRAYIPRVWNTQHLITKDGAEEFSTFMTKLWRTDPKTTKSIIKNLVGEKDTKKLTEEMINSSFAPGRIRNMFRNKADSEIDVHRSSHLEHQRKIHLSPKYEHLLDPFMAKPVDRWSKFFEDIVKRNEFARRFGAKDQRILKRIKELEDQKKGLEADHLREAYFTTIGDANRSKTLAGKRDNPLWMKGVARINAFQNLKLGLAAIPNATQAFVNGTTKLVRSHGLVKAPFKAISAIVRATVKTRRDADIWHRAGVLGETDLGRIATENMPHARLVENEFKGPLKYLNEPTKFLRAVGFLGVEEMNRRAAAIMAHGHIATMHSKLLKLKLKGKGDSKKAKGIEREMKRLGVENPHKPELSQRDYAVSGHMFNKQVNFSGESFNIPTTWQGPFGKLFTKFKSFMFYQARFLKREVSDELFLNHNATPLLAYLSTGGIAGNTAEMARALATGKDIEENRNALELLISGIGNAGGSGLWWDTLQQITERGPAAAWGSVLGPTASDIAYTIQDIGNADINNIIKRMLPNVPGKHQLMDSFKKY